MKTYTIKELTQNAYIGFTSRNELISKAIRAYTGSDISHAFVGLSPTEITEALGNHGSVGVVKNSLQELMDNKAVDCLYIAVPDVDIDLAMSKKWQKKRVGKKYDYFNTGFLQVLYKYVKWLPWQQRERTAEKKYQCAEYCAHWIQKFLCYLDEPFSKYSPEMLKSEIVSKYAFRLYKRDEKTKLFFRVI